MQNLIGQTIGSHQIVEKLGRGGMANVYKGYHTGLAVYRAVKVIRPDLSGSEGFEERFRREARAVAGLRHPHVVQMHDFGQFRDLFYMVMEFVEGEDLKARIAREGAIRPFSEAIRIAQELASAIGYAHEQGVLHRDIKPDNVLLQQDGHVILADFGIAKMLEQTDPALTATGTGIGTPNYMAPELAMGKTDTSPAQDLYAIGVVLYEMLTAKAPFAADTPLAVLQRVLHDPVKPPTEFTPDIPDALQGVVLKAMAFKPEDRYPSAEAFIEAAGQSLAGVPTPPTPPPVAAAVAGQPTVAVADEDAAGSRHRGLFVAAAFGLVLLTLLAIGLVYGWRWWNSRDFVGQAQTLLAEVEEAVEAEDAGVEAAAGPATDDTSTLAETAMEDDQPANVLPDESQGEREPAGPASNREPESTPFSAVDSSSSAVPPPSRAEVQSTAASAPPASAPTRAEREVPRFPSAASAESAVVDSGVRFGGVLTFGSGISDSLEPEDTVEYEIEVRRPTYMWFDIYASRPSIFTLVDGDGEEVFRSGSDVGPVRLEKPGVYRLTVETEAEIPVEYEVTFRQTGG